MPETLTTRSGGEGCVVFSDARRREVRVTYEPDGTPLFCATDIASCMGYKAPTRAIYRTDITPKYRRPIPWVSKTKRGCVEMVCIDRHGVEQLLDHGVPTEEVVRWVLDEVVPQAEALGAKRGYEYEPPATERPDPVVPVRGIVDRLDSIILEALLLKQEIQKGA